MSLGIEKVYKQLKQIRDGRKSSVETCSSVNRLMTFIAKLGSEVSSDVKKVLNDNVCDYSILSRSVSFTIKGCFYIMVTNQGQYRCTGKSKKVKVYTNSNDAVDFAVKALSNCKVTSSAKVYLGRGKVVTASSTYEAAKVIALDVSRIKETTKELYDRLNEGDYFEYNSRIDDNFQEFIDNTIQDEIHDIIKSDRNLIRKCIERRSSSSSIVWDALYKAFNDVKKRCHIKTNVTSDKMKNWFVYNGTDYKKALRNVIDNMSNFRQELREEN